MPCKDYESLLDDLVDGTLAAAARRNVEAHLETCAACRVTVADLRGIREAARALPRMEPPADGWARVSAALDQPGRTASGPAGASPTRKPRRASTFLVWRPAWGALAAAAILAVAVVTTLLFYRTAPVDDHAAATGQPANAPGADLVSSVETELQLADQHYQKAIAGLEQVWREGQGSVDPQTAAVLQKNMGIIDQAVRESREALRAQPTDEVAQTTLFEALRHKVDLLKDMVALVNEMRKGNQAGAAQIVGGIER